MVTPFKPAIDPLAAQIADVSREVPKPLFPGSIEERASGSWIETHQTKALLVGFCDAQESVPFGLGSTVGAAPGKRGPHSRSVSRLIKS